MNEERWNDGENRRLISHTRPLIWDTRTDDEDFSECCNFLITMPSISLSYLLSLNFFILFSIQTILGQP